MVDYHPGHVVIPSSEHLAVWKVDKSKETFYPEDLIIDGVRQGSTMLVVQDPGKDYLLVLVGHTLGYVAKILVYHVF